MSYDWTRHVKASTLKSGGRVGAPAGGRVFISVPVTELRNDFEFWVGYLGSIVERYLLPNRDEIVERTYFCDAILDLLDNYERELEVLAGMREPPLPRGSVQDQPLDFDSCFAEEQ